MVPPSPVIAAVVPAYRVALVIAGVLARIPPEVRHVVVVDDASPDNLQEVLASIADPRLAIVRHAVNGGVGRAMKTGFARALELGADIVVKIDGDGQMAPELLPIFVAPIVAGDADFTKGNRFDDFSTIDRMPLVRRLGNLALSFLVKIASGYWHLFDPCNGYLALTRRVLKRIDLRRVENDYFFEISLLCEAYFARAVLRDIPMEPRYEGEPSSLSPARSLVTFAPRLVTRVIYRVVMGYFVRDFNVASVFLVAGVPSLAFGAGWSAYYWAQSIRSGVPATTGTVMIGVLAIVLGFQVVLQAVAIDVTNEPRRLP
jgi:glycosyltransferase involved in cell wall biosynthesis